MKNNEPEPVILCCMRLDDMIVSVQGQIERPCSQCGETVTIANAGQGVLRSLGEANVIIICQRCIDPKRATSIQLAPGAREEALQFFLKQRSN